MAALSLTQESMAPTVSTPESDLNSKIQQANTRRKEDVESTKWELAKIEELFTKTHLEVNKRLEDHGTGLILLHESQMHLELDLKVLMTKMGVTSLNTLPTDASVRSTTLEVVKAIMGNTANTTMSPKAVEQDLDGNFQMTEEVFDQVLEDCSRARGPLP